GAAHDEQDVAGVDLQELLLRVLAAALRRDAGDGALDELQQRLLHALARHVAGDRRVLALARDLVDLVDVDDALLRLLDVVVALLQQLLDDVLDVLADVPGLGQRGRVGHGERDVEHAGQGLGQQGLAGTGGAHQQAVGLGQLDVVVLLPALDALVVVVHRHRQRLLRPLLADHVLVEDLEDLLGLGQRAAGALRLLLELLADDVVAQLHAFIADEHARARDQLADLVLALPAERAAEALAAVAGTARSVFGHAFADRSLRGGSARESHPRPGPQARPGPRASRGRGAAPGGGASPVQAGWMDSSGRRSSTWSTRPYSRAASALLKLSRSVSWAIVSIDWPVWRARISFRRCFMDRISRAWISMSVAWPWKPPRGWWIMTREFGSA